MSIIVLAAAPISGTLSSLFRIVMVLDGPVVRTSRF